MAASSIKTKITMSEPGAKKRPPKKCKNFRRCRRFTPVRKSGPRKGRSKGGLCYKCACAQWRSNSPMRAAYHRLKSHAKDRDIEFTITFTYWEKFAKRTHYLTRTGPHGASLTVDRKDNLLGYVPGNLKAITRAKNSEKKAKRDAIRLQKGYGWATNYGIEECNPF